MFNKLEKLTKINIYKMAQMVKAKKLSWAAVVAQLVEQLLPTPEVCSSNPVIGKLLYQTFICFMSTVLKRRK